MIWTYKTTVDLDKPNKSSLWETIASVGNKNAHGFEIHVVKSGVPVDLSGSKVHLFAKRQDGATRHIDGKISNDNAAVAELDETCYEVEGELTCTISIDKDDASFSAACIYFLIGKAYGDAIVDPSHTIPSLTEILSQIEATKSAAKAAQDAAGAANTAAGTASTAAQTANTAANGANTARDNANKASGAANTAAEKINNMTVTADALDTGSEATADLTTADGHYILHLGLPRGATGATPQLTITVQTGEPGTQASVVQSGTAENPVLTLTIPRGDTGNIGNLTVNGKAPDASGAVTLGVILTVDGSGDGTLAIGGGST